MGRQGTLGTVSPLVPQMLRALILLLALSSLAPAHALESIRILTQNMNRLFDDVDDGNREKVLSQQRFRTKVKLAAKKIGEYYSLPEIIALQEVENINVLGEIADEIWQRHGLRYQLVLVPGQDISGINLGYLVHPAIEIHEVDQLFADVHLDDSDQPLFTRPPLYIELCRLGRCLSLLNLHLRSMRGIDSDTPAERERVLAKRWQQANRIAAWVNRFQKANPGASLMLLGDFNALTPPDSKLDLIGIVRGNPDNGDGRRQASDLLDPDLVDLSQQIPLPKRYSYIFRKQKQQLDYMLVNQDFQPRLVAIRFGRIDYRFSDHAGLIARFDW